MQKNPLPLAAKIISIISKKKTPKTITKTDQKIVAKCSEKKQVKNTKNPAESGSKKQHKKSKNHYAGQGGLAQVRANC